jgi:hypothetical protein
MRSISRSKAASTLIPNRYADSVAREFVYALHAFQKKSKKGIKTHVRKTNLLNYASNEPGKNTRDG